MINYIFRRLIQMFVVLFLLSFFVYTLLNLMPGDPLDIMISSNPRITSDDIARLKELYGVDKPIYVKYLNWLKDFLSGDLGYSRTYKVPTTQLLGPCLINTFFLMTGALSLSVLLAIPLGVFAALKKGTRVDYIINLCAFSGISIPSFWLGIVLMFIFAVKLKLLPAGGTRSIEISNSSGISMIFDRLYYMVLPMCSLMAIQMGVFVRFARSTMIEVMEKDYIRTARAKGIKYKKIVFIHAFKNALIPLITVVSINCSYIFSGAMITETVFAYQGIGRLVFDSVIANDFNVAMIAFTISIAMVFIFNLIADILYAVVDPRISYK